jgi:site-specific DNA-methyltransferase (adenine-specific)
MNIDLRLGDCLEVLKTIPDNSVDSVVVDPPYHLTSTKGDKKGFMGKDWDGGDIAFRTEVWSECLRVLKPGGHLLSFSSSRTYHRMAVAIEDAGFEIRDSIMWIYGSGFPKSHNIGKAIDKIQGNEREDLGYNLITPRQREKGSNRVEWTGALERPIDNDVYGKDKRSLLERMKVTKGHSDYEGWGTALKPAHEPICMARKPLSEKSIAENVLKWGTGGINIDESRVEYSTEDKDNINFDRPRVIEKNPDWVYDLGITWENPDVKEYNTEGRFPANIIFDEEAGKLLDEQSGVSEYNKKRKPGNYKGGHRKEYVGTIDNDIEKKVEGQFFSDKGVASRFFYCPKTSKKERGEGNVHPTVKPLKLMEYLITLVTPKGGVVMDCFMGSGSTGIAAKNLGFSFIGIEKEQEYFDIAQQRINSSKND